MGKKEIQTAQTEENESKRKSVGGKMTKYYRATRKSCPKCGTNKSVHIHTKTNWANQYPNSVSKSIEYEWKEKYCSNCAHTYYLKRNKK